MKPSTFVRKARAAGWDVKTTDGGRIIHLYRQAGAMYANDGWNTGWTEHIHCELNERKGWRVTRDYTERVVDGEHYDALGFAMDQAGV